MSYGSVSTHDLKVIKSWEQAHDYYKERDEELRANKRIRNRFEGVPLQTDGHSAWGTKRLVHNADDSYSAVLYETDVVRWYPDGAIKIDTEYGSRSSIVFADRYAPISCDVHAAKSLVVRTKAISSTGEVWDEGYSYAHVYHNGTVTLRLHDGGVEFTDNVAPHVRRLAKRADVSRLAKPVVDYISTIFALNENALTREAGTPRRCAQQLANALWGQVKDGGEFDPTTAIELASHFVHKAWVEHNGGIRRAPVLDSTALAKTLYGAGYEERGCYVYKPVPFGVRAPTDWVSEDNFK